MRTHTVSPLLLVLYCFRGWRSKNCCYLVTYSQKANSGDGLKQTFISAVKHLFLSDFQGRIWKLFLNRSRKSENVGLVNVYIVLALKYLLANCMTGFSWSTWSFCRMRTFVRGMGNLLITLLCEWTTLMCVEDTVTAN